MTIGHFSVEMWTHTHLCDVYYKHLKHIAVSVIFWKMLRPWTVAIHVVGFVWLSCGPAVSLPWPAKHAVRFPSRWTVCIWLKPDMKCPWPRLTTESIEYCTFNDALTHWGWYKMDNILQTTFSNVFSSMKIFEFRLTFHWSLFLRFQFTIFQHWFRYWVGTVQLTRHYLNQWWLDYRQIYVSLGLIELMMKLISLRYQYTKTGIFLANLTRTISSDALVPCISRSLSAMILPLQDKQILG